MTEGIFIQRLTAADVALARQLIGGFLKDDGEMPFVESNDERLGKLLSQDTFHMVAAIAGGKVIGGVTAYEMEMYKRPVREMFFYEVGVREDYRRQGIGSALIDELKNICRERNILKMYVLTDSDNAPANRFYIQTGGKPDATCVMFNYDLSKER